MRENRKLWGGGGEGHESHLPTYKLDELSSKHAKWLDHMSNLSQAIKDVQPIPMSINGILLIPQIPMSYASNGWFCLHFMGFIICRRLQSSFEYISNSFFRIIVGLVVDRACIEKKDTRVIRQALSNRLMLSILVQNLFFFRARSSRELEKC